MNFTEFIKQKFPKENKETIRKMAYAWSYGRVNMLRDTTQQRSSGNGKLFKNNEKEIK